MIETVQACRLRVGGIVQGVGFRPFVWRVARELGVRGWVLNDGAGVDILAEGDGAAIAELQRRLRAEAPPLARVDSVEVAWLPPGGAGEFAIRESGGGPASTTIGPDVATCPDCLAELFSPQDRRWRHAFVTCTHCGPRYTVTLGVPYDRARTSLAPFPLCPACAIEYGDPADRRFHAETTCCPRCGPHLALTDASGGAIAGDPIAETLALLRNGGIVAVKGLGGFHLACDARNAAAVARLRERKQREAKPFAVMAANGASLAHWTDTDAAAGEALVSRERPIVLLPVAGGVDAVLPGVAPGLDHLGAMLPLTPIQYLLFHEAAGRPAGTAWLEQAQALLLVMTSANPGGEPIVRTDAEAHRRLAGIVDAVLGHDREIVARCDDSVRRTDGGGAFLRRSRGYNAVAIPLPAPGPAVLACGAYLKSAICVTRGAEAFLSPHIGDLENPSTCEFLDESVTRMLDLLQVRPEAVAHDLHPDFYSTRVALEFAARAGIPAIAVGHHHAHIAGVCAEHGIDPAGEAVLGLALDGVGLGPDGGAWGGELLRVDGARCERLGHLRPLPLPGGDRAAEEPWRMAAAVLHLVGRGDEIAARFDEPGAATIATMLARGINCPPSSSLGRVFDAAAGLLGLCRRQAYEAQAAILLEQRAAAHIARHGWPLVLPRWEISGDGTLDLLPLLLDLAADGDVGRAAAGFHAGLGAALAAWAAQAAAAAGGIATVAASGGCMVNALLADRLEHNLATHGLRFLRHRRVPPGDGGLALGQAWVAIQSMRN